MARKASGYDESDIQHFSGLEGIRKKPEMYIGNLEDGIFTILREAADNAVDEYLAGRNESVIILYSLKKLDFWIIDSGQGIPVGKHKSGVSTLKLILTETHAGAKFEGKAYAQGSAGTHGVGLKATTALSQNFEIYTFRDRSWYYASLKKGKWTDDVEKSPAPKLPISLKPRSGTVIHFNPDPDIFGKATLNLKELTSWASIAAYMNPGIKVTLFDLDKKNKEVYFSERGPIELVEVKAKKLKAELDEGIFEYKSKMFDIVVAFGNVEGVHLAGFTNGLTNAHGGKHIDALVQVLKTSIGEYANSKDSFTPALLLEGSIGIVNIHIPSPKFSSQTKEYLADPRASGENEELMEALRKFWKKNKELARTIINRANQLKELQATIHASKKLVMQLKPKRGKSILPSKLMSSLKCRPEDRELFLVEGESAQGNARFARDQSYQEVLPLKGKILNVAKGNSSGRALESEEVLNILKSIGYQPQEKDPISKLRVGRILLMADADPDGEHINVLLLTLFQTLLPQLIQQEKIYIVNAPEYVVETKGKVYFGDSLDDLRSQLKMNKLPVGVKHMKGWGESSTKEMETIGFDPNTRKLIKIEPPTPKQVKEFKRLMSEDPTYRKELLGV